ncbi:unnamed protein product [Spirodela intermedia]|uniref:Uncharacterized protein n=1 Tax=Spirodela intermedia TaxID=51605 RepID=A0A7I8K719_SPIIN|nr:unnamed protein product [Spirodela intermedia]
MTSRLVLNSLAEKYFTPYAQIISSFKFYLRIFIVYHY